MSDHPRNTGPMLRSPRCGAKTRSGKPCASPAVHGKVRCRMHGGARGSGAPLGNRNAMVHGGYTREAIAQRRWILAIARQASRLLQQME
ncbi:MAG: HGGxSTG domain-containing protein [Thermomicrobiales bacterium]